MLGLVVVDQEVVALVSVVRRQSESGEEQLGMMTRCSLVHGIWAPLAQRWAPRPARTQ